MLTRTPRPLPQLLDGLDDRIVVVRCDVTDRADLANALFDIRACGSTIRGAVHAAGVRRDAEFATVTPGLLAELFEPRAGAARHLIDLTAADPIDFVLLSSSATGALGAPGQAADAAAHAALDALARNRVDDRVRSIGWGHWISGPVTPTTDARWRRAGVTPFDVARGTAVLSVALAHRTPALLAVDYTPTGDTSPMAARLRNTIPPHSTRPRRAAGDSTALPGRPAAAALSTAPAEDLRTTRHRDSPRDGRCSVRGAAE